MPPNRVVILTGCFNILTGSLMPKRRFQQYRYSYREGGRKRERETWARVRENRGRCLLAFVCVSEWGASRGVCVCVCACASPVTIILNCSSPNRKRWQPWSLLRPRLRLCVRWKSSHGAGAVSIPGSAHRSLIAALVCVGADRKGLRESHVFCQVFLVVHPVASEHNLFVLVLASLGTFRVRMMCSLMAILVYMGPSVSVFESQLFFARSSLLYTLR